MIEINNLTRKGVDEKFLKGLAKKVLKEENREEIDLSVAFVDKKKIKELGEKAQRAINWGAEEKIVRLILSLAK